MPHKYTHERNYQRHCTNLHEVMRVDCCEMLWNVRPLNFPFPAHLPPSALVTATPSPLYLRSCILTVAFSPCTLALAPSPSVILLPLPLPCLAPSLIFSPPCELPHFLQDVLLHTLLAGGCSRFDTPVQQSASAALFCGNLKCPSCHSCLTSMFLSSTVWCVLTVYVGTKPTK